MQIDYPGDSFIHSTFCFQRCNVRQLFPKEKEFYKVLKKYLRIFAASILQCIRSQFHILLVKRRKLNHAIHIVLVHLHKHVEITLVLILTTDLNVFSILNAYLQRSNGLHTICIYKYREVDFYPMASAKPHR